MKQWILSLEKVDKACYDYKRENGERLIVSYSDKRAKKDAYNRDRGIVRLRKAYKTGRITKSQVNKRGYNKFLEISKDIEVVISEEKIAEDCQWDGLKATSPIQTLTPSVSLPSIMDSGWWNVHSVFQKELWKCVRCFILQNVG